MRSISQFTLQSLSVTRSPLEMSQMSHWHLKYYHWLDIYNWCTVYTDHQNMMKDSLRRRVGSFPSCHVWVHWRLRVSNVFHYGGTAAGYIDSEDQFCWVSGHEEGGHATTQEERGSVDRYILASCYLDFCLYLFVLNTGLGSSWLGYPPFPQLGSGLW